VTDLPPSLDAQLDAFVDGPVATAAAKTDAAGKFPTELAAAFLSSGLGGLISAAEVGGAGGGTRAASKVVERIARQCGSTAMIVAMHYCAAAVVEAKCDVAARRSVAQGLALGTLAFSEAGSRSHFWAPVSTAERKGSQVVLNARKNWVTSANHATFYIWSSRPVAAAGPSTLWLVARETPGIETTAAFDGLGLRGNDSAPVTARDVKITPDRMIGEDGGGADVMLGTVLPIFCVLNASAALGLMSGAVERTIAHMCATRFEHLDQTLREFPTARAYLARMQVKTESVGALLEATISGLETPDPKTMLRVLEIKAAAGETANEVLDIAMRVCGGAAYRKEVGVERIFRDARANSVMAPSTDQLYDFIGRALCGMDLFA
jgi:alkylation response protein AidB-like acyl-CoA dehydrogenase